MESSDTARHLLLGSIRISQRPSAILRLHALSTRFSGFLVLGGGFIRRRLPGSRDLVICPSSSSAGPVSGLRRVPFRAFRGPDAPP
jgi:hypothetical protein